MNFKFIALALVLGCLLLAGCAEKKPLYVPTPTPTVVLATPEPTLVPTPEPTIAPTAEPTAVPTPTPLPFGTLFFDDFEDRNATAGKWVFDSKWKMGEKSNRTALIAVVSLSEANSVASFGSGNWTDYVVRFKFWLGGGGFRLIARNSSAGAYIAEIMPNTANLRIQHGSSSNANVVLTSALGRGQDQHRLNESSWHDLEFFLKRNNVKLNIDGIPVFDYSDNSFSSGSVALMTVDGVFLAVDDVNVSTS
ncbi:TPA: hypothetical protein HA318_04825 [Candidatus Micrarchaeota archaeon]|nr:hypothetical protein [Candidatus Micrarchaeota archaeon]